MLDFFFILLPNEALPVRLNGAANEGHILINGIKTQCLVDSGSTVSTISQSFHKEKLAEAEIHPLDDLLHVEDTGGIVLPYGGYVDKFPIVCKVGVTYFSSLRYCVQPMHSSPYRNTFVGTLIRVGMIGFKDVTEEQLQELKNVLQAWPSIFVHNDLDILLVELSIRLFLMMRCYSNRDTGKYLPHTLNTEDRTLNTDVH